MGGEWKAELVGALWVMWRGQQSNYGTAKDMHRTERVTEKEQDTEKKKKKIRSGGCNDPLQSPSRQLISL